MLQKYKKRLKYILFAAIIFAFAVLFKIKQQHDTTYHPRDYNEIIQSGILRVVTEYNSVSFYLDGDSLSGFHYELIRAFAQEKGLKIEIMPEMSFTQRIEDVEAGKFDVLANNTLITVESKDSILFTHPIILSKQILVQRKGPDSLFIKSQLDLAQRTLHVVKGSPALLRIHNLGNEIGDTIYVQEIDKYGSEQLLAMVAHGDIDYAVCDEKIAYASIDSFPQLDISTDISFTQFYSWGVSKHSPVLLDSLNSWLDSFKKGTKFQSIYEKYYPKNLTH